MEHISRDDLRTLLGRQVEVSISIFMPTAKSGRETQQNSIRFKNLVRKAEERIHSTGLMRPQEMRKLLKPIYDLFHDVPFWQHQEDGLALFLSKSLFRTYRIPTRFDELAVVDSRFYLKPLLRVLTGDGRFHILALSRKQVKLYESTRDQIHEVDLGDTPTDFLDVVGHDLGESYLQWHTGTPAAAGGRSAQFHGQGGGEDDIKAEIHKFFLAIDRGLRKVLLDQETPLVLAGVEYLLPIYRDASSYPRLVKNEIRTNPADLSSDQLREKGWSEVRPIFVREQEEAMGRFRSLTGTGRASQNLVEILPASDDGRVEILLLARGARRWGVYDPERRAVEIHDEHRSDSQDLLDLAAVQTFLQRGKVYVMEGDGTPLNDDPIAAVFRY